MLRLSSHIQLGDYTFTGVVSVEVSSSWENLTDTAIVTFPRRSTWQGRELATGVDPLLRRYMPIIASLGYDNVNDEVFRGLVRDIVVEVPVRLVCEDDMYTLKQNPLNLSYRNATLGQVLQDIAPGVDVRIMADRDLGPLRFVRMTPAQVFDHLRQRHLVRMFFRQGVLYVGLAVVPSLQRTHAIAFERQVVENNLEWRRAEDVRLRLRATIIAADNSRQEVEIGDPAGELRSYTYYRRSVADVKALLEAELTQLRYDGYQGSFTTFGRPLIQHGDRVVLSSAEYPERNGAYLVRSVTTRFGLGGYRQEVELYQKVEV